MREYSEEFRYAEQFSSSPLSHQVDHARLQAGFGPLLRAFERGVEEKVFKEVGIDLFSAFMFMPLKYLANPNHCQGLELTVEDVEAAFQMAWDAVKR